MADVLTQQPQPIIFGEKPIRIEFRRDSMPGLELSELPTFQSPVFDPAVHLCYMPGGPQRSISDLGVTSDRKISNIGCAPPFPLFTEEAVDIMRAELLRGKVFDNCAFSSSIVGKGSTQVRGWTKHYGPFTDAAWKHPATIKAISEMAGVDLVPVFDYEIAHANVAFKSQEERAQDAAKIAYRKAHPESETEDYQNGSAVLGWHFDSYPFVCVLMLSDTTNMFGGETVIHSDDGQVSRVPDPKKGSVAVLQGRVIEHLASKPIGGTERITFVTSYRARDPLVLDDSVLTTVSPISDKNELYTDWVEYRMRLLSDRLLALGAKVREGRSKGENFNLDAVRQYLIEQENYIKRTYKEMNDWD